MKQSVQSLNGKTLLAVGLTALLLVACATSPLGRKQFLLKSASEMDQLGIAAYQELKSQTPISTNPVQNRYVSCITQALLAVVDSEQAWEITVFEDNSANAFALPGGKMGVHTGLLTVADNQHQLAAVIGHEIGHVLAQHSNERVSMEYATNTGLQIIQAMAGEQTAVKNTVFGLLGVGAQVGVALPFSRKHETEADLIGLEYMAKAGFDPRESVKLWENMTAASGGGGLEFLSTHPSGATRIRDLNNYIPKVMPLYEQARASGRQPQCSF